MALQRAFAVSAAGLTAQRTRMETVASNLANARTTRTPEGGPYRRQVPVFSSQPTRTGFGDWLGQALHTVRVQDVVSLNEPPKRLYEPNHPDADATGYVNYPAIEIMKEMMDMLSATRSYEANVTTVKSVRGMLRSALEIIA